MMLAGFFFQVDKKLKNHRCGRRFLLCNAFEGALASLPHSGRSGRAPQGRGGPKGFRPSGHTEGRCPISGLAARACPRPPKHETLNLGALGTFFLIFFCILCLSLSFRSLFIFFSFFFVALLSLSFALSCGLFLFLFILLSTCIFVFLPVFLFLFLVILCFFIFTRFFCFFFLFIFLLRFFVCIFSFSFFI